MTRGRFVTLAVVAGLWMPSSVLAHHSSSAFDTGKKVVLKGTVKEWIYSNPHCFLMIEVKGEDGQVVQWVAETQAPAVIFPAGYRRDTFKAGDQDDHGGAVQGRPPVRPHPRVGARRRQEARCRQLAAGSRRAGAVAFTTCLREEYTCVEPSSLSSSPPCR